VGSGWPFPKAKNFAQIAKVEFKVEDNGKFLEKMIFVFKNLFFPNVILSSISPAFQTYDNGGSHLP